MINHITAVIEESTESTFCYKETFICTELSAKSSKYLWLQKSRKRNRRGKEKGEN